MVRADSGFSKAFEEGEGGAYLLPRGYRFYGCARKMLQFENWNLTENYCTRNTSNAKSYRYIFSRYGMYASKRLSR